MASGSNRKGASGGKRTQSGRKTHTKRQTTATNNQQETFTREVVLWVVVAVSILLFISNFGIGGIVGNTVSRFFFGIFGFIAYIFPVVLLVGTFFCVSNKGNTVAAVKMIAAVLFVAFLCMFLELLQNGAEVQTPLAAYRHSFDSKFGGGIVGGFLAWLMCPSFGLVGSYVIDAVVLIISLVLITERSALRGMQKGGKKVYETAKQSNERNRARAKQRREERELRREEREQQREERELRRMDRKVEGVALDTRILPEDSASAGPSDELCEMNAEQFFDLPEIKEERAVTLTAGSYMEEPSVFAPPSESAVHEIFAEPAESAVHDAFAELAESAVHDVFAEPAVTDVFPGTAESAVHDVFPESAEPAAPVLSEEVPTGSGKEAARCEAKERTASTNLKDGAAERTDDVDIAQEIQNAAVMERPYQFPPITLLKKSDNKSGDSRKYLQETASKLQQTLKNFGVNVTITNISCGPAVTRYELQPEMGVKVSKIVNLADDIKLNLAAADIRIEAPIPGKAAVGIEVPNKENVMVSFRELVESEEFQKHASRISFCVGKDIGGKVTVADIAKMPHLLIAGATGSGKSVCINTIIMSILYKANPRDVKLIMIDPKVVELSVYNGIPHLLIPVVTDPKKAAGALHWAVAEMTDRYQKFAETGVRDLKGYNDKVESLPTIEGETMPEKLPQIVIIVDELADLMMVAPGDVEEAICRLAQLARACGIHLIIATQRPSVNVITGLIKANMPSRIAFAVTSGIDSRTILDMNGAEKLLGKGDMLFHPQGVPKPLRVQGAFVSDREVTDVVAFLKEQNGQGIYSEKIQEQMSQIESTGNAVSIDGNGGTGDGRDAYFAEAARLLIDKEKGSIGMLQRYFKIGFNRAARIMDQLEEAGIVGPEEGTKPRRVLMSPEQFEAFEEENL